MSIFDFEKWHNDPFTRSFLPAAVFKDTHSTKLARASAASQARAKEGTDG